MHFAVHFTQILRLSMPFTRLCEISRTCGSILSHHTMGATWEAQSSRKCNLLGRSPENFTHLSVTRWFPQKTCDTWTSIHIVPSIRSCGPQWSSWFHKSLGSPQGFSRIASSPAHCRVGSESTHGSLREQWWPCDYSTQSPCGGRIVVRLYSTIVVENIHLALRQS